MTRPLSEFEILEGEFEALHGVAPLDAGPSADPSERLRQVRAALHSRSTSALCLSGGGVRSATFALGVLQGLAHIGALGKLDYLSTVSGGGYIGGWLTAWLHRAGPDGREAVFRALDPAVTAVGRDSIDAEPVDHLRRTCQYLAPSGQGMSADFWALLTTMGRNLMLNWFVLLPLIGVALLVPRMFYALSETFEVNGDLPQYLALQGRACLIGPSPLFLTVFAGGFAVAVGYVALVFAGYGSRWSQQRFLGWFIAPLVTAAAAGALFWAAYPCDLSLSRVLLLSAALPASGWMVLGIGSRWLWPTSAKDLQARVGVRTVLAAAVSGLVVGLGVYWFATFEFTAGVSIAARVLYAVIAVPFTLGLVLVSLTLFVGFASDDLGDGALEWWSRCGAFVGLAAVIWLVACLPVFYGAEAIQFGLGRITDLIGIERGWSTGLGGALVPLLGSIVALLSRASVAQTSTGGAAPSLASRILERLAVPLVIVLLLSTVSWVNVRAVERLEFHRVTPVAAAADATELILCTVALDQLDDEQSGACHPPGAGIEEVLILGGAYLVIGLLMSYFVPVNRFSLHGMYRQRLMRTFLGASHETRDPNPFTGFDVQDDLRIHQLADVRPLHIINTTLNAASSTTADRHQRQSQAFSFSPLYVGNRGVGYRPAAQYGADGGAASSGLSLGMALAVSGAAASSSMGMYTSKAKAFLLTLANARLGLWFGNPANADSWRTSEPPVGVTPLLRELLGLTSDRDPYVYLSDGGHYENLAIWEMVARRCRFIVVSDAGCDPDYGFEDLSNATRRIRLDLGVPIEFGPLGMTKAGQGHGNAHAAVGVIRYSVIDGPDAPDGTIVYLKATLSGDEPVDVLNFAHTDRAFPHDSTSEQFFDEARFESYRTLGFHTVLSAAGDHDPATGIAGFCAAVTATTRPQPPTSPGPERRDAD